jgi:hypothetical protein
MRDLASSIQQNLSVLHSMLMVRGSEIRESGIGNDCQITVRQGVGWLIIFSETKRD